MIACANLRTSCWRAVRRPRQASLRIALGAPRTRLIRQTSESLSIAVLGGLLGIFFAVAGTDALLRLTFHSARFFPSTARPPWR